MAPQTQEGDELIEPSIAAPYVEDIPLPDAPPDEEYTPARNGPKPRTRAYVPPHSIEAEEIVLGTMMEGAEQAQQLFAAASVDDFFAPAHQRVAAAVLGLLRRDAPTDPVAVLGELRAGGNDSAAFVGALYGQAMPVGFALHHAGTVAELSRRRALYDASVKASQAVMDGKGSSEVFAIIQDELGLLERDNSAEAKDPDLDDFLAEPEPEYDWLVDGLLERGDRVILVGGEGKGKSTLLRQIAVQVGAGIHPFTLADIAPAKVVIVDLENSRAQVRRKIRAMRIVAGDALKRNMVIPVIRPGGLDLMNPEDQQWLTGRIQRHEPDLLVIGPLYKLHSGEATEEGPAKQVALFLDQLRARFGIAIIMESHSPHGLGVKQTRPARPYGASLWMRWPEFGLSLENDGRLKHWRGARDERAWPEMLQRGGVWPWSPVADPRELTWLSIVDHVREAGSVPSFAAIAERLRCSVGYAHGITKDHPVEWAALKNEVEQQGNLATLSDNGDAF